MQGPLRAERVAAALCLCAGLAVLAGCKSTPEIEDRYRPSASVLEVVAVLRQHVPDDTYRFAPARDFTGRNVYRSSLLRLENLERMHARALRAGHMDGVIAFAKARALERIRAYGLAAEAYRFAAERESALAQEALRSASLCERIEAANALSGPTLPEASEEEGPQLVTTSPEAALAGFEQRASRLEQLASEAAGSHYAAVVHEEIERADVERARYFVALRDVIPDGDVRAVSELQRVALQHPDSKNAARHLLSLADLYTSLTLEYVEDHPPEGLSFDPAAFQELVDSGARLYEMVAARDGTTEKLEASRRLEALLAFSIGVDRDRFTP